MSKNLFFALCSVCTKTPFFPCIRTKSFQNHFKNSKSRGGPNFCVCEVTVRIDVNETQRCEPTLDGKETYCRRGGTHPDGSPGDVVSVVELLHVRSVGDQPLQLNPVHRVRVLKHDQLENYKSLSSELLRMFKMEKLFVPCANKNSILQSLTPGTPSVPLGPGRPRAPGSPGFPWNPGNPGGPRSPFKAAANTLVRNENAFHVSAQHVAHRWIAVSTE